MNTDMALGLYALFAVILTASLAQAQSLDETFDWMANSLKPHL
jgi:hypothetical protein